MTCVYGAPGRLVEGQTTPAPLERWRGPNGYTLLSWEVDFREGAACRLYLRSRKGKGHWVEGVHLEIAEPERVVFTGNLEVEGEQVLESAGTVTFRRT